MGTSIYFKHKEADLEKLQTAIARLKTEAGSADTLQELNDRFVDAKTALDDLKASGKGDDLDARSRTDTMFRLAFQALERAFEESS